MSSVPKSQYDDLQRRHENMRKNREREQRRATKLDEQCEKLKQERLGIISQSKMHPSWFEKSKEEILDCLRFQGATTAALLEETKEYREQIKNQAAEIAKLKEVLAMCEDALETVPDVVDPPPDMNCSCHIAPPCGDCVDYGGLRELFNFVKEALAAISKYKEGK